MRHHQAPTRPTTHLSGGPTEGAPRRLACWSSSSFSCCSRSISMMRGTTRTMKVVPAIQAAFPVLRRSFLETKTALEAASLPRDTIEDWENLEIMLLLLPSALDPRRSGRETPPFRDAMAAELRE